MAIEQLFKWTFVVLLVCVVYVLLAFINLNRGVADAPRVLEERGVQTDADDVIADEKNESHSNFLKYGLPQQDNIIKKTHFIISYDPRFRIPFWTLERLTPEMMEANKAATRKDYFRMNKSIPKMFRVNQILYLLSGYDKGHFACAGNYQFSQAAMDETFETINVAPMNKSMNRGIWGKLEERARKLAEIYRCVYIMTGPLFLCGENGLIEIYPINETIAVPTHFYKVILCEVDENVCDIESYIVPNRRPESPDIENYMVSKNEIEKKAGIEIFPGVDTLRHVNDSAAINQFLSSASLMITEDATVYSSMMASSSFQS